MSQSWGAGNTSALADLIGKDSVDWSPGGDTIYDECLRAVLTQISVEASGELERRKDLCLNGNPYPLIAYYWPELLITDPAEEKYFQGTIGDDDDPCLRIDDWQRREVLDQLFREEIYDVAVKGNTKPGKGASIAIGINLWFEVFPQCKIILTSSSYDHAKDVLFAEVAKWRRMMRGQVSGKLLNTGISDHSQHYLAISNPTAAEGFTGQHGPATLFVFDEASAMEKSRYDDAQKQAKKVVMIGNPRHISGAFYKLYDDCKDKNVCQDIPGPMGLRRCVTVGGMDCANVRFKRLEKPVGPIGGIDINGKHYAQGQRISQEDWHQIKPLIPQQVDYARYMAIKSDSDARHAAVFADGHFPDEDPDKQVILRSYIKRHTDAHAACRGRTRVEAFGFDVARSTHGDASVLTCGGSGGITKQVAWKFADTTYHARRILQEAKKLGIDLTSDTRENGQGGVDFERVPICVDMDGVGAGVGDILRDWGCWVIEFRGNATALVDPKQYANWRTEAYALFGRRVSPHDNWAAEALILPDDEELLGDLCTPEKNPVGGDALRFRLQPKQEIADKLGRSPDKGDSAVYWYTAQREYDDSGRKFKASARKKIVIHTPGQERSERGPDHREPEPFAKPKATDDIKDWASKLKIRKGKRGGETDA